MAGAGTAGGIPEDIRRYRPMPGTEIKKIRDRYYVYEIVSRKLKSGKWGKASGKCIGSVIKGTGFVPNKNYKGGADEPLTILEYGQYALLYQISRDIEKRLQDCFDFNVAGQIYSWALILNANGFCHLDQADRYYEQSWLALKYKDFSFKMGRTALDNLLDDLGRRGNPVKKYQQQCIDTSSAQVAVDGHAIRSCSDENDLGEAGYKFSLLKEDQINLLMGYDINSGEPLFSRMYRGACPDMSAVKDLLGVLVFKGILFIVDRGFYSAENIKLFSQNANTFIIPVPAKDNYFKKAMSVDTWEKESFYYVSGSKHSRIEYRIISAGRGQKVYVFKDIEENEKCRFNYQRQIDLNTNGYTAEKLEKYKDTFGIYVLRSNCKKTPAEIFTLYKKRWGIETFYQYLKNVADFNDLKLQDYCKCQGFSFIMLIAGQIHSRLNKAVKVLEDKTTSTEDLLIMSRCLKYELQGGTWFLKNSRKKDLRILAKAGFIPENSL